MADEIEITEDDIRKAAERVEAAAREAMETEADEPAIVTETTRVETIRDGDEMTATLEERVVEVVPESALETAPDMARVDYAEEMEAGRSEPKATSGVAVYPAPDEDEFVVVEGSELAARVAADEPEEEIEGFTTLQALSLAFLVLLNIIVIGLGIWQVSRYFGWI